MVKDKVLIFGNGQIGNFYQDFFNKKGIVSKIADSDITKINEVKKAVEEYSPSVVINTAAKTNLEWCSENKLEAFNVNVLGADNIAQVCDEKNIYFIHFSSGCIFQSKDEKDVKKENDEPDPAAYYAWNKVWSEQLIQFEKSDSFKYLILRPRQPISAQVHYKNMLMKLLTFVKFVDTPNTGTVIEDLMEWTLHILEKKPVGILHVANEGWTTPYEIGLLLKKHVLPSLEVNKISKEELDKLTPNKRVDTILNVDKLKKIGVEVKPYKQRLEEIIIDLAKNIKLSKKDYLQEQLDKTVEQSKSRTVVNNHWKDLLN
jgi:dTDP-4-dehydrorhamnose reductase